MNQTRQGGALFGGGLKLKSFGDELGVHRPQGLVEMDKSVPTLWEEVAAEQNREDKSQAVRTGAVSASNTPNLDLVDLDGMVIVRVSNCTSEALDLKVRQPVTIQDETQGYDLYLLIKEAMEAYGLHNPDHDVSVEYWANSYGAFIEFDIQNMHNDLTDKDIFISKDDLINNKIVYLRFKNCTGNEIEIESYEPSDLIMDDNEYLESTIALSVDHEFKSSRSRSVQ